MIVGLQPHPDPECQIITHRKWMEHYAKCISVLEVTHTLMVENVCRALSPLGLLTYNDKPAAGLGRSSHIILKRM